MISNMGALTCSHSVFMVGGQRFVQFLMDEIGLWNRALDALEFNRCRHVGSRDRLY